MPTSGLGLKSNGRGVFVLAEKSVGGKDVRTQILEKLTAS